MRQFINHGQGALHCCLRLKRVNIGKARHPRDLFIQARIVLHRATAQREEAEINGVILAAEARIMAHSFRL